MNKQEFQTLKEASWRNHLARHAASGKSIAAFCWDEASSQANFHVWRTKLANATNGGAAVPTPTPAFAENPLRSVLHDLGCRRTYAVA